MTDRDAQLKLAEDIKGLVLAYETEYGMKVSDYIHILRQERCDGKPETPDKVSFSVSIEQKWGAFGYI